MPEQFILIFFVSERHDLLCSHSNHLFTCEDSILFLYVPVGEDIMFSLDSTPGVSLVFI